MIKRFRVGKFILSMSLILALGVPSMGFADGEVKAGNERKSYSFGMHRNLEKEVSKGERRNRESFLEIIKEYSPETFSDWEKAMGTRKDLHEELKKIRSEFRDKNEGEKENREKGKEKLKERKKGLKDYNDSEIRAKLQDIKSKLDSGEITEEEAKKQFEELRHEHKELCKEKFKKYKGKKSEWKEKHKEKYEKIKAHRELMRSLREELIEGVKADDAEVVRGALSKMLIEFEKVNEVLSYKVEEYKARQKGIILGKPM